MAPNVGEEIKRSLGPLEKLAVLKLLWWAKREVPKMRFLDGFKTYLAGAAGMAAGLPDLFLGISAILGGDFTGGWQQAQQGLMIVAAGLGTIGIGRKLDKAAGK